MRWLSGVAAPILKTGGSIASMAGFPQFGIPMEIAGGAASGSREGFMGAAKGAGGLALKDFLGGKMGLPGVAPKDAVSSGGSPMTIPGKPPTGMFGGS